MVNNVIYDNEDPGVSSAHSSLGIAPNYADFRNNIVLQNPTTWEVPIDADYSLFYGNDTLDENIDGDGNLFADPRFVDPDAGDFTLEEGYSPAIDAGDPSSLYDDPDGSRNDLGLYGGPLGSWDG